MNKINFKTFEKIANIIGVVSVLSALISIWTGVYEPSKFLTSLMGLAYIFKVLEVEAEKEGK